MLLIEPHHEISLYMSMPGQNPVLSNVDLTDTDYRRQLFVVTRRTFDKDCSYHEVTTTVRLSDVIAFIESKNVTRTEVVKPPIY